MDASQFDCSICQNLILDPVTGMHGARWLHTWPWPPHRWLAKLQRCNFSLSCLAMAELFCSLWLCLQLNADMIFASFALSNGRSNSFSAAGSLLVQFAGPQSAAT